MKTLKTLLFPLVCCLSILACNKSHTEENMYDDIISSESTNSTELSETIFFGDDVDMQITQYSIELSGSPDFPEYYVLDINEDGIEDIKLLSQVTGGQGNGYPSSALILSLHEDCLIQGILTTDTSFTGYSTNTFIDEDGITHITNMTTYSCTQLADDDEILSISTNQFKLLANEGDDEISINDIFESDSIVFIKNNNGTIPYDENIGTDTVLHTFTYYYRQCWQFPNYETKYVGLKIIDGETERLAWIKLKIEANYAHKIYIYESAIQE